MEDYCKSMLEDFLANSFASVKALVEGASQAREQIPKRTVNLFQYVNGRKMPVQFEDERFYLRSSVEYTNPHLTVEEVQGIFATRLLETCANYFLEVGLHEVTLSDISVLCERLKKPPSGYIVPFLLNTDDVEADRYSMNPLRKSIVDSGQSAYPVNNVRTDTLKIDDAFVKRYDGSLISQKECELITETLSESNGSYLNFVDTVKYMQMMDLSKFVCMDLSLYSLRMPLSTLDSEEKDGLLHYIIRESNKDYSSVEAAYTCMGRSMNKRTTLLTIPHSKLGFGSKRAARGKLHFENNRFLNAKVTYKTTPLYPNDMDPEDVSVAVCEDQFTVLGSQFSDYRYCKMPSSPQFFLYSLASPEDAALWHAVGATGSSQLLQSYANVRIECREGRFLKGLQEKYSLNVKVPLQFNLAPDALWSHPVHHNVDASIGCIQDIPSLIRRGMKLEYLSAFK